MKIEGNIKLWFLSVILCFGTGSFVYGQMSYAATQSMTLTQKTCYSNAGSMAYTYNVYNTTNPSTGGAYVCGTDYTVSIGPTKFELKSGTSFTNPTLLTSTPAAGNIACVSAYGGMNVTGTFDLTSIAAGQYTIWATIVVSDIRAGRSVVLPSYFYTFRLGYTTEWADQIEMQLAPNSYSCNRSTVSASLPYAGINSINQLNASANGWVDVGAQFSSATTGSVYVVLGKTTNISSFSTTPANSSFFYLLFNKTGASTGTVSVVTNSGTTILSGVLHTDRIFVERTLGNTVKFYKNNATTVISGSPTLTNTSEWNIACYTAGLNNGALSVISTLPCANNSVMYAELDRELKGVDYPCGTKLNFSYNEEYNLNVATNLSYRILNNQHRPVQCYGTLCSGTAISIASTRIFGDNRIELDVSGLSNGSYILEVTNDKKELFYLRFTKN